MPFQKKYRNGVLLSYFFKSIKISKPHVSKRVQEDVSLDTMQFYRYSMVMYLPYTNLFSIKIEKIDFILALLGILDHIILYYKITANPSHYHKLDLTKSFKNKMNTYPIRKFRLAVKITSILCRVRCNCAKH